MKGIRLVLRLLLVLGAAPFSLAQQQVVANPHPMGNPADKFSWLVVGSKVFLAYNSRQHSDVHFACSVDGGEHFTETGKTLLPNGQSMDGFGGASLAMHNGKLYLAFHGGDNNRNINVIEVKLVSGCPDSVILKTKVTSPLSTDGPPLLLSVGDRLLIGFMERGNAELKLGTVTLPLPNSK